MEMEESIRKLFEKIGEMHGDVIAINRRLDISNGRIAKTEQVLSELERRIDHNEDRDCDCKRTLEAHLKEWEAARRDLMPVVDVSKTTINIRRYILWIAALFGGGALILDIFKDHWFSE